MSDESPKLLSRDLADYLVERVETAAQRAKREMPQIRRVAVHGSYLSDAEMIGDVDIVFEVGALTSSELRGFCARYPCPVPAHVQRWPEVWTLQQLRISMLVDCHAWRILRPHAAVRLLHLEAMRG